MRDQAYMLYSPISGIQFPQIIRKVLQQKLCGREPTHVIM